MSLCAHSIHDEKKYFILMLSPVIASSSVKVILIDGIPQINNCRISIHNTFCNSTFHEKTKLRITIQLHMHKSKLTSSNMDKSTFTSLKVSVQFHCITSLKAQI